MRKATAVLIGVSLLASCQVDTTSPPVTNQPSSTSVSSQVAGNEGPDLLFRIDASAGPAERANLATLLNRYAIVAVRSLVDGTVTHARIGASEGRSAVGIARALEATGAVEFAEVDVQVQPAALPDDPLLGNQWHHTTIRSAGAWDITTGSASVLVGVCDTGMDLTHPDLVPNVAGPGYNVVTGANTAETTYGHGVRVAGVIGAAGNNAEGVSGVNWTTRILPIRVNPDGGTTTSISNLVACIDYARSQGARVVNLSYTAGTSSSIDAAGKELMAAGGLLFVSAGNDNQNLSGKNLAGIILVGGTDETNAKTSFSNYGPHIDLVGPAIRITTTVPTWNGTYVFDASGTSFSSPMAAGVAALIWSVRPDLTPLAVQDVLFKSARDLGPAGYDKTFGYGLLDAQAALTRALTAVNPPPPKGKK